MDIHLIIREWIMDRLVLWAPQAGYNVNTVTISKIGSQTFGVLTTCNDER